VRGHDDDELVARTATGDKTAFAELVECHGARVLALAQRILQSRADAEDIVQEVFVRSWQQAAQWKPGQAQYGTWLHRVTVNLSLNHLTRVSARFQEYAAGHEDIPDSAPTPERALESGEIGSSVLDAVGRLPPNQRIAIGLRYSSGLSVREIGQAMSLSDKAVESLLVRAKKTLRTQLTAFHGD
jgi:RNA polymerase sigma-70 factor (ECF subfamily)